MSIGLLFINFYSKRKCRLFLFPSTIGENSCRRFRLQLGNALRLRLLACFFDWVAPILTGFTFPCCPFRYSLPRRNLVRPIIKTQYQSKFTRNTKVNLCSYGGPGRNRTAVRNTFLSTSYSNIFYVKLPATLPATEATRSAPDLTAPFTLFLMLETPVSIFLFNSVRFCNP